MRSRPRVALWGAGMISQAHAAASTMLQWPVTAVASRSADRARERAITLGATPMTYDELATSRTADLAFVTTPPANHADDATRLLDHGWAVVLEKPLCDTLDAADALVETTERPGRHLLYAENAAYAPVVGAFLKRVPQLGPVTSLEVRALQGLPSWGDFTSAQWGGGALFDLGAHPVAICLLVARAARVGALRSVEAHIAGAADGSHDTDEWGRARLTFESGLRAQVMASWQAGPQPVWDLQAASDTGVLRAELLPHGDLEQNGEPVPVEAPMTDPVEIGQLGYLGQLSAFAEDIRHGRSPVMDARFGRRVLEVICAAYQSAGRDGAPITFPYDGPRDQTPLALWTGSA